MAVEVIGSTGASQQAAIKSWAYSTGEGTMTVFKGPGAAIEALYQMYKTVAGYNPTYDSVETEYARGVGQLVVRTVADGATIYELYANELQKPVYQHSHFASIDVGTVAAIRRYFALGLKLEVGTALVDEDGTSIATAVQLDVDLYTLLCRGTEYYLESAYVLRETKTVSKRSSVQASFTGINTVSAPPDTSSVNTIIGALPSGEWLKRAPVVRQYGVRRWQIVTEWWWAEKWSLALYGGTATP